MYGEGYQYYARMCRTGPKDTACERCEYAARCDRKMPAIGAEVAEAWRLSTWSPSVWQYGMNGIIGMDFIQVGAIADSLGIGLSERVMEQLKVIEKERLKILDEQREKTNG